MEKKFIYPNMPDYQMEENRKIPVDMIFSKIILMTDRSFIEWRSRNISEIQNSSKSGESIKQQLMDMFYPPAASFYCLLIKKTIPLLQVQLLL
jgi:hypothetical protein